MAQETGGWLQTYVYDAWGNRALVSGTQYYIPGGTWTPQVTADNASLVPPLFPNNRWTGAVHDGAGNQTALPGYTFTYDGENRLKTALQGTATTAYSYDGDGRRVKKVQGSATTVFVYDAQGQLAAEYSTQPETDIRCTTCYLTADHLGSTRLMTDGTTGLPKALHDYLPFGEEIPSGIGGRSALYGTDSPRQRFTGKERDTETGLDYFGARYLSAAQGRFTTVDPVTITPERMADPQQLNAYAYVRNNPLRLIDPTGEELKCTDTSTTAASLACMGKMQEIAGDAADRLSINRETGVVAFNTTSLDLVSNEGAKLLNDLITSSKVYGYEEGSTIRTAGGEVSVMTVANLPVFGDQVVSKKGIAPTQRPSGVDDQVVFNPNNRNITVKSNTNLALAKPYTVVFHELAEAYQKVDRGQGGTYAAAHNAAILREDKLRSQRPNLQGHNPGSGGPANGKADHTMIIRR